MKAIRLYAQVLVDVVLSPGSNIKLDAVMKELREFAANFMGDALVMRVLDNPTLAEEEKQKILRELLSKAKPAPLTEKFLMILLKRNRVGILPEVLKEVERIQVEKAGGLIGELVSAVPLDPGVADGVAQALSKKLNKPVQLKEKVDSGIIAGMRVTIGGVTYDGSIRNRLDKLMGSFK